MAVYYDFGQILDYATCPAKLYHQKSDTLCNTMQLNASIRRDLYKFCFSKLCISHTITDISINNELNRLWVHYKPLCTFPINSNIMLQLNAVSKQVLQQVAQIRELPIANNFELLTQFGARVRYTADYICQRGSELIVYQLYYNSLSKQENSVINLLTTYLYYAVNKDFKNVTNTVSIKVIDILTNKYLKYQLTEYEDLKSILKSIALCIDNNVNYPTANSSLCSLCSMQETCSYKI